MSFNRLHDDKCAYEQEMKESTSPLDYLLFKGKYENCQTCALSNKPNFLEQDQVATVENELYNLNRSSSLCSSKKYNPNEKFPVPKYTPPSVCEGIYYLTPTGLERPSGTGYDTSKLGKNFCSK